MHTTFSVDCLKKRIEIVLYGLFLHGLYFFVIRVGIYLDREEDSGFCHFFICIFEA